LTRIADPAQNAGMLQRYHTIIKPQAKGRYVGWVEEIPGAMTHGKSLDECRKRLRDALELMVETNRQEARLGLNSGCIQECIEIDVSEAASGSYPA
jgi:predicted RNase H-like HicB family nuclease